MIEVRYRFESGAIFSKLATLEAKTMPFARSTMRLIAQDCLDIIKEKTPGKGTIRELWQIFEERQETVEEWIIRNTYENKDILWYLEKGTKPHKIFPKHSSVLAWEDADAPRGVRFSKYVFHPGTKPYGMVKAAYDSMNMIANRYINELLSSLEVEMEKAAARNRGELV